MKPEPMLPSRTPSIWGYHVARDPGVSSRGNRPCGGIGNFPHDVHIPRLVNIKKAVKNLPKKKKFHVADPYVEADRTFTPSTLESFRQATKPSGVTGDPTLSTLEKGKRLHKALVDNLVELIKMARKEKVVLKPVTPCF